MGALSRLAAALGMTSLGTGSVDDVELRRITKGPKPSPADKDKKAARKKKQKSRRRNR